MTMLPKEFDFDPYGGCLDAQSAWRSFGGLTVDEAYKKFCERPEVYQEDFMFMGWTAFRFYFPVIEKWLSEAVPEDETDDFEAWIIGCAVESQIEDNDEIDGTMHYRIMALCDFVIDRFDGLDIDKKEKKRVLKQWQRTKEILERTTGSI